MDTERRGGRKPTVHDHEIRELMDKGLNAGQMAEHFTERGRQITRQALGQRLRKLRDADEERANFILPWRIRQEHARSMVYLMVVAYGKQQKGLGLTPYELDLARKLDLYLRQRDAVMSYDRERGFVLRNRRPDDGATALVA